MLPRPLDENWKTLGDFVELEVAEDRCGVQIAEKMVGA
jgi:hypothetical protein